MSSSSISTGNITSSDGLEKFGFVECGKITYSKKTDRMSFTTYEHETLRNKFGSVYIWALWRFGSGKLEVLYVGSTKDDVYYRCRTWRDSINEEVAARKRNGEDVVIGIPLKKLKTHQKVRKLLIATLKNRAEISIWGRVADDIELFERRHSLFKTEEDTLIDVLVPPWNGYQKGELLEALEEEADAREKRRQKRTRQEQ